MNFPVYVLTSDKYLHALRPFAYLFNRYWSINQRVIVGGFTPPDFELPPNFQFYSIGKMEDYPVNKWSNAVGKFLTHFRDPIFCLMLEDYWITKPVHIPAVHMLADYMKQFDYVIKTDLYTDRRFARDAEDYGSCGFIPLVKSHPHSPYHMSLMCGLWNWKHFLKILIPDETPWDLEIAGTTRLSTYEDELVVIGTKTWDKEYPHLCPVSHTLAFRSGDSQNILLNELSADDVAKLKELKYID